LDAEYKATQDIASDELPTVERKINIHLFFLFSLA